MPRILPLALLAAATACSESPPDRDGARAQRPVSAVAPAFTSPASVDPGAPEPAFALTRGDAARLLDQATFGPRPTGGLVPPPIDSIDHVVARGATNAVNDLLAAPAGSFATTPSHTGNCDAPFDPAFDLGAQFFVAALTAPDQLRLRTAYALHQILVVSEIGINEDRATCNSEKRDAMTRYLNALRSRALGSYRELLEAITLEPAMGTYLDMANNVAFDDAGNRITPNENFARELLQLFTVGTTLLDDSGRELVDGQGNPRPAYTEAQIQALARTLSGWTYPDPAGCPTIGGKRRATYAGLMIPCNVNHDNRAAQLLSYPGAVNGGLTTAGASARVHLEEALDNLFNHPNLPPFVCKQLIGHLVTSNPSPEYVARVVAVFKDDATASHRRGNLRAVVKAILLDPEARGLPTANSGRLRSPAELVSRIFRSLGTTLDTALNPGRNLNGYSANMGQSIPRPASVFSYYAADTPVPGDNPDDLIGPAFGVLDTGTITVRANFVHDLLFSSGLANNGVLYDLTVVPEDPAGMLAWIDESWLSGAMTMQLRDGLTAALADPRSGSTARKRQLALYLAAMSPEFQIQR